jgi:glycosyltransferase involved in cell wall biosynthesis
MKILFVIHSLYSGGAEKSLISLLNELEKYKDITVDLLVAWKTGLFLNSVPKYVNILDTPEDLKIYSTPIKAPQFPKSLGAVIKKSLWRFQWGKPELSKGENMWNSHGKKLKPLQCEYDVAVSYMNGFPNYYVIEKVNAKKKLLWVHNDYNHLGYNDSFEKFYFEKADKIATISPECANSIEEHFPQFKEKIVVLENISSKNTIKNMSEEFYPDEYDKSEFKILSLGRLNRQKGFDMAVDSAKILKDKGIDFKWYVIGDGEEKASLENQIAENNLQDSFILLGQRSNPYPYIKHCNIFVQSSRFEGKSIVLDEAKILCKPIVVTNYNTVYDSIEHNENGYICNQSSQEISNGIERLLNDISLQEKLTENLAKESLGNEKEVEKYLYAFRN